MNAMRVVMQLFRIADNNERIWRPILTRDRHRSNATPSSAPAAAATRHFRVVCASSASRSLRILSACRRSLRVAQVLNDGAAVGVGACVADVFARGARKTLLEERHDRP